MGKQPTTGQKKTKDQIQKAATQKKGGHKKWTKGKTKQKSQHAVFVDQEIYNRMLNGIPKLGKHISVTTVIEKYKVVGSIARALLRTLHKNGSLKLTQKHSKQSLYGPTVAIAEKTTATDKDAKKQKGKKEKKN